MKQTTETLSSVEWLMKIVTSYYRLKELKKLIEWKRIQRTDGPETPVCIVVAIFIDMPQTEKKKRMDVRAAIESKNRIYST